MFKLYLKGESIIFLINIIIIIEVEITILIRLNIFLTGVIGGVKEVGRI